MIVKMLTVNTSIKSNEKFTTASLGCFLRLPLTKHNLAYASLLSRMQTNASLYFPSIRTQQEELSQLYDLQLEIMPQLFGKELLLSYVANFVEPLELLDPDYSYAKIVEDLALIVQHPSFDPALVSVSQKQLLADYKEIVAEPSNYALDRFFNIWYQDEPDYAENFMGPIEEITAATSGQIQRFSDSLRSMPTTIIGLARDPKSMNRLIREEFKQAGLLKKFMTEDATIITPKRLVNKTEEKGNLQAQLMLGYGYRQKIDYYEQVIGMVLAQYLAGDPSSKLFTGIREELGAAYDVEANNFANNSLFLINAGVAPDKSSQAEKIIRNEMAQIGEGKIDDDLLKKAKRALVTVQKIGQDQPNWQLAQMLRENLFPEYENFDRLAALKKVTAHQLQKFVQNLFLNESYILK